LFDRAQSLTSGGVRGWRCAPESSQIFIAITRRVIAISPGTPGAFFSRQIATIFFPHRGLARLLVPVRRRAAMRRGAGDGAARGNFHQFSPVRGLLLKLMLCRRNVSSTGVLLLIPKDGMTVEKVSLSVLAVLGVVGLAYIHRDRP